MTGISCEKSDENPVNCSKLRNGLLSSNYEHYDLVVSEVDKLTTDLKPEKTENDPIGHQENLDRLIERLNSSCNIFEFEFSCYACREDTKIPLSIITARRTVDGRTIEKMIFIHTPDFDILRCASSPLL